MMMSLDGYIAAPEQSAENPFGIGGMQLNEWLFPLKGRSYVTGGTAPCSRHGHVPLLGRFIMGLSLSEPLRSSSPA
jgi:hypothetical protein